VPRRKKSQRDNNLGDGRSVVTSFWSDAIIAPLAENDVKLAPHPGERFRRMRLRS
jgi:hypothetical protein